MPKNISCCHPSITATTTQADLLNVQNEQNLHQKGRNFFQNKNGDKMTYLIKYTLAVQFLI